MIMVNDDHHSTSFFCGENCQSEIKHCWCTGADVHPCAPWCLLLAVQTANDWWRHQCYSTTSCQDIGCWSHSNISVEADCTSCRFIRHRTVQRVARCPRVTSRLRLKRRSSLQLWRSQDLSSQAQAPVRIVRSRTCPFCQSYWSALSLAS